MEAAFFDLDKTVIASASMVAFGRRFYQAGLITRRSLLRGLYGQLVYMHLGASEEKLARMREAVLRLTRGWDQAKVKDIVAEALEAVVEPITYAEALELMGEHRRAGRKVVIISASPEEIVEPIGLLLGADQIIASQALVDQDGRYTGEMARYAYGPFKADIIREMACRQGIDLERSYAYSDSASDLPMLDAVGHPVAVNPDRPLLKVARDRGWEVRRFDHPVRLRARVPALRPASAATATGVAALALVAWLWWRHRHGWETGWPKVRRPATSWRQPLRARRVRPAG